MACLIDIDHDDCYEELHHSVKKARKKFQCCECRDDIHRGEMHDVFVGEIHGRIDVMRTCLVCESISNKLLCSRPYQGMYEEIYNAISCYPDLENCILMMASKEEYAKLVRFVSFLDQDPYGEDEEE